MWVHKKEVGKARYDLTKPAGKSTGGNMWLDEGASGFSSIPQFAGDDGTCTRNDAYGVIICKDTSEDPVIETKIDSQTETDRSCDQESHDQSNQNKTCDQKPHVQSEKLHAEESHDQESHDQPKQEESKNEQSENTVTSDSL